MTKCFHPNIGHNYSLCGRNTIVATLHRDLLEQLRISARHGEQMPSLRTLAKELKVAPQTLQQAYCQLEAEGHLERSSGGRIWHVRRDIRPWKNLGLLLPCSFSDYMLDYAREVGCHRLFYASIVETATELGYATIIHQLPPPDAPQEAIDESLAAIRQGTCGIIHFGNRGFNMDAPLRQLLHCHDIPQVMFNCVFDSERELPAVLSDGKAVISSLVNFAYENGHRRIGLVKVDNDNVSKCPRVEYPLQKTTWFIEEFIRRGVSPSNLTILEVASSSRITQEELCPVLASQNLPTLFWCRNDDLAINLVQLLKSAGKRVPEDISVIGYNDLSSSSTAENSLTTFHNPLYEMGRLTVQRLVQVIEHGKVTGERIMRLPPTLVIRSTTATAPIPRSRTFKQSQKNERLP
ncbi:MAG: substrate-binding domain-containing protein [Victivallales bacterium]|nr:substrate-binding domain-containing protein [Victivallales bacterium]